MAAEITLCEKRDADGWILNEFVEKFGIHENAVSSHSDLWDRLSVTPDSRLLVRCENIWGIEPDDIPTLSYENLVSRVTKSNKIGIENDVLDRSTVVDVVDCALMSSSEESTNASRFDSVCAVLDRSFLTYGSFYDAVRAQLSLGQPSVKAVLLHWTSCLGVGLGISIASLLLFQPAIALLGAFIGWLMSALIAWMFFVNSPTNDEIFDFESSDAGRAFLINTARSILEGGRKKPTGASNSVEAND